MLDVPAAQPQFPVCVLVLRGGWVGKKILGSDMGVITFSDDLLHFEGRATAFDLPSKLVKPEHASFPLIREFSSSFLQTEPSFQVVWQDEGSQGKLFILPYLDGLDRPDQTEEEFRKALLLWSHTLASNHTKLNLPPITARS